MKFIFYIFSLVIIMSFRDGGESKAAKFSGIRDTLIDLDIEEAGKIARGFFEEPTVCGAPSNWVAYDDKGNGVLTSLNAVGRDCISIVTYTTACKNFTITSKIKSMGGQNVQGGGLLWRYVDNKNYYRAGYNTIDKTFQIHKVVKGIETLIQSSPCEVTKGYWYTMSAEITKDHFVCWLNGEKLADIKDKTFKKEGKFGMWVKEDARTYFDELVILPQKKKYYY